MLNRLEGLPGSQRDALGTAFGLGRGVAPDRFLVGLAVLSLLSEVAEERPLVCLVDDAQWLDHASAQALAFAARRLLAEPVALVFAVRALSEESDLRGLPELPIVGLGDEDARSLLRSAIPGRLDERVLERIVAETRGNPLALLELPRGLPPAELAGGFGLLNAPPLASRIEQSFLFQLEALPPDSRQLMLLAAAEPLGDRGLLGRAGTGLGIGVGAAAPAEYAGLIEVGTRVRFRHPLVRSAIYRAAVQPERQLVHRALAEATDPDVDPDRRAWHRACAATGPDEGVAAELEGSAGRAQARGGAAAAAAFLERATELTPDPARRGARALAAAQAKFDAGAPDAAHTLLATADSSPIGELKRAQLRRLHAQIAFALRRGSDAPPLLLDAAERLAPLDPALARETYLEALGAAMFAARLSRGCAEREVAAAARAAPPPPEPPRAVDLLLDGLAVRFADGYAAGLPLLRRALHAFRRRDRPDEDDTRWLWLACRVAPEVWDDEAWHEMATRGVTLARTAGVLSLLPIPLVYRAGVAVHTGDFDAASALISEADAITHVTGNAPMVYTALALAA